MKTVFYGREKKLNHNKKRRRMKREFFGWIARPVQSPHPQCYVLSKAAWPLSPPWTAVTAAETKRNRTAVEYGKIEKERSDEITVGTEEGGKYWQRRREDRTWWLNSPGWMPKLSSTKVRHAHTHNICKNHCIHKKREEEWRETRWSIEAIIFSMTVWINRFSCVLLMRFIWVTMHHISATLKMVY